MNIKKEITNHIGTLLKNSEELHDLEWNITFNIHLNTFLKKLIPKELLGSSTGARINSDDFCKGLIFLDYFCNILDDNYQVRDNLIIISKKLREIEKDSDVDKELSYLPLDVMVGEAGLYAKERKDPYSYDTIKERYDSRKRIDFSSRSLKKADLYYDALGLLVHDLVGDERKGLLRDIESTSELGAIIFSDCVLGYIKDSKSKSEVNEVLKNKKYLKASLTALDSLIKESSKDELNSRINEHLKKGGIQ